MSIAGHFSRKERSASPKSQGPSQGELTVHITVLQILLSLPDAIAELLLSLELL